MSFDLYLQKFVAGAGGACTPEEAAACQALLASITDDQPDEFRLMDLRFPDGSHTEFAVWKDPSAISNCTFFIRGFSPAIIDFAYRMAVAGDFIIFNAQGGDIPDDPLAIATSQGALGRLPADVAEHPTLCRDAPHLATLLGASFGDWQDFRDRVVDVTSHPLAAPPKKRSWFARIFRPS